MRHNFVSLLLSEIAPSMGITIELEPQYGFVGEIIFPNGKRHLFKNSNFNINPSASVDIVNDKGYSNFFLNKYGFRTAKGKTFFSELLNKNIAEKKRRSIEDAVVYAKELGFPVFMKPNNMSQGELVAKVFTEEEMRDLARRIFERTHVLLIEEPCIGNDYRVVVLGDEIISAYQRLPLSVVGDSKSSINELLVQAKSKLGSLGRPNAEIDPEDFRIDITLKSQGLTRSHVPVQGKKIDLLYNANLSTGGTSLDVTQTIHPSFVSIAKGVCRVLGLRYCGVDLICDDITKNAALQNWVIIEVNASPGLDNYAAMGEVQAESVKQLYRKILLYLGSESAF